MHPVIPPSIGMKIYNKADTIIEVLILPSNGELNTKNTVRGWLSGKYFTAHWVDVKLKIVSKIEIIKKILLREW